MVSITASVAWWARTEPQRLALVYGDQRLSYGDLQQRVERAAALLHARGIGPGAVVALLMKNSAAFLELSLAIGHIGAVLLPVNYRLGADEVGYIASHAGVQLLFADEDPRFGSMRRRRPIADAWPLQPMPGHRTRTRPR